MQSDRICDNKASLLIYNRHSDNLTAIILLLYSTIRICLTEAQVLCKTQVNEYSNQYEKDMTVFLCEKPKGYSYYTQM
jgi:hypothetical protein